MRMGRVIGTVTLSRRMPNLERGRYIIVQPESQAALREDAPAEAGTLVVYDDLHAGFGDRISFSEGREAAMPFHPLLVPVDAYCSAIIDEVNL
jgi:microcompartment protein CcmK/EutM